MSVSVREPRRVNELLVCIRTLHRHVVATPGVEPELLVPKTMNVDPVAPH